METTGVFKYLWMKSDQKGWEETDTIFSSGFIRTYPRGQKAVLKYYSQTPSQLCKTTKKEKKKLSLRFQAAKC